MSAAQRWTLAALLALMACGDDAPPQLEPMFEEQFESACEGLPCGWTQIAGPAGATRWVTTIHPGEHGLELEGEGVAVRGPTPEMPRSALLFSPLRARAAARCDAGAELQLRVTALSETDSIDIFEGRLDTSTEWGGSLGDVTLDSVTAPDAGPFSARSVRVVGVEVHKTGPGICEIDSLWIDGPGGIGFVSSGC